MKANVESNKVIAEFDGWKYVPTSFNEFINEHYERGRDWCSVNAFTYHEDWNSLIGVVEKIEAIEAKEPYTVVIKKCECSIYHMKKVRPYLVARDEAPTKLKATYTAIAIFIKSLRGE